jgi:hypothetical protein
MKRSIYYLFALLLCSLPVLGSASQITIFDNQKNNTSNTWHNQENEDEEVEPGATSGQEWDLEGMFFDGTNLSIVGGWDFVNGSGLNDGIGSGDIFISTSAPVHYGSNSSNSTINNTLDPHPLISNSFGYNYVFDINWEGFAGKATAPGVYSGNYTLWQITPGTLVTTATGLGESNPVAYHSGAINQGITGTFTYESGLTDEQTGFKGGNHYQISGFDLSGVLGPNGSFTAHFTQECGNDTIMGQVPEPATMLLLGMGLLGISAIARKLPL